MKHFVEKFQKNHNHILKNNSSKNSDSGTVSSLQNGQLIISVDVSVGCSDTGVVRSEFSLSSSSCNTIVQAQRQKMLGEKSFLSLV